MYYMFENLHNDRNARMRVLCVRVFFWVLVCYSAEITVGSFFCMHSVYLYVYISCLCFLFICACTRVFVCVCVFREWSFGALGISDQQRSSTSSYETEHWTHSHQTKLVGEL